MSGVILQAYANDWIHEERYLRDLIAESVAVTAALRLLAQRGALRAEAPMLNATVNGMIAAFQDPQAAGRVRMFHFGGHADGVQLMLEDAKGGPAPAHAEGLAGFLGKQNGLVLVFLNGCATAPQVKRLREAGVKTVVATTRDVQDTVAAAFAAAFYTELARRPLKAAFDTAAAAMRMKWGNNPSAVRRALAPGRADGDADAPAWPWLIDCDPAFRDWKPWRPWVKHPATIAAGIVVVAAGIAASVLVSGHAPSAAEQAAWTAAITRDDGAGLRAYVREYPRGAHTEEARSRLAGCEQRITAQSPEKTLSEPLFVAPDRVHRFPDEAAARSDALSRGAADAERACASLGSAEVVLGSNIIATTWTCTTDHACGFDGSSLCRVRVPVEQCKP